MSNLAMICRMDNVGLGTLSQEYSRHLKPFKVLLTYNDKNEPVPERYAEFNTRTVRGTLKKDDLDWLFDGTDILLSFETFYDWNIVKEARARKVKTALLTMIEMTPARGFAYTPDILICPSSLDYDYFKDKADTVVELPVPVATDRLIWQKRTKAKHLVHSGSHGGMDGRKGTGLLLKAMEKVKSDVHLTVYTWGSWTSELPNVEVKRVNFRNYWQLWREGDVLVYPQGANGICLPIIEAMACGLGVITTDIAPFNQYMPQRLLFPHEGLTSRRMGISLVAVQDPILNADLLAEKIDEIAGTDISAESEYGREWALKNSWDVVLPDYQKLLYG